MNRRPVFVARAGPADVDELLALVETVFQARWRRPDFETAIDRARGSETLLMRTPDGGGSAIVAFCCWQQIIDEMHVHNVAVAPAERRRGLARALLLCAIGSAARRGAHMALLEVRAGNEGATGLYASLGFERLSTRRGYYTQPLEDAVVLRKRRLP